MASPTAISVVPCQAKGDVTQWINVICFGDTARQLTECARKGDRVYVEGSLTLATWQDGEGKPRSGLAVSAWKVEKLFAIGMEREKGKKARKRRKKKLQIVSGIDLDFNDALPF
jgi:single-stranded DNA-binding protein